MTKKLTFLSGATISVVLFVSLGSVVYAAAGDIAVTSAVTETGGPLAGAPVQVRCSGGAFTHFATTSALGTIAATAPPVGANCVATGLMDVLIASTTGYVTKTDIGSITYTTSTSPNNVAISGVQYMLKLTVADELGNTATATTATYNGLANTTSTGNIYYYATSGTSKVVAINKAGFISATTTNAALLDVSASSSGQTAITLGAYASSATAITASSSVTIKGFQYMLKSGLLTSEIGGAVTGIATGNTADGTPSADVTVTAAGGAAITFSAVNGNVIYIAATGNGGADDTFFLKVQNVTVDGGGANAVLVSSTLLDAGNLVAGHASQIVFDVGTGGTATVSSTGFKYPLKVTATDELGTAMTFISFDTATYSGAAANYTSAGVGYYATSGASLALILKKDGYVDASTTNTGLTDVSTNQTSQTSITFGTGSVLGSAVTAGSAATAKGLLFGQKVTVTDSDSAALNPERVTAGSGTTECTLVANVAYCAVPVAQDGGTFDIIVYKTHYTGGGSTGDRTGGTSAQATIAVTMTYSTGGGSGYYSGGGTTQTTTPVVTVAATTTTSAATTPAAAQTSGTSALQAQVNALMAQLQALIAQANARGITVPGGASQSLVTGFRFFTDLWLGSTGSDVQALQRFLNQHGFTVTVSGAGSAGNETTVFGNATQAATKKLQASGNISQTGYFGPLTRGYVNAILQ